MAQWVRVFASQAAKVVKGNDYCKTLGDDHYFVLFVWVFSSHPGIFHYFGDVTIAGEGLQILNYARHSWRLRSEESLTYQTYHDTGHSFIMVISEDP